MAIDIDENYVRMTSEKIAEMERKGYIERESIRKSQREYSKKELQLALRDLAAKLGRLPTPEDVQKMSEYDLEVFLNVFPTWGKALKAAKLPATSGYAGSNRAAACAGEIFHIGGENENRI